MSSKAYLLTASALAVISLVVYLARISPYLSGVGLRGGVVVVPRFLTAGHGDGDEAMARGYYTQIAGLQWNGQTCQGQRCTLAGWKSVNGFSGGNDVHAIYYNEGELGLARDVHCRQINPVKVACYVTNYGANIPANPLAALVDALNGHNPRETLAIEAARSFGQEGETGFFVYAASPGNPLSTTVALDSEGEKYVPEVCQTCHGGQWDYLSQPVQFVGGTMLPFDVFTFSLLSDASNSVRRIGAAGDPYQETFRRLNGLVLESRGRGPQFNSEPFIYDFGDPIRNLIVGWYDHCANLSQPVNGSGLGQTLGCIADDGYLPSGWAAKPVLYQTVYRRYCRSCHNALDGGIEFTAWPQFAAWSQPTKSTGIGRLVCNIGGPSTMRMPNAEATYKRFWSGSGPTDLTAQLNFPGCAK